MQNESYWLLHEVGHVQRLIRNLISIGHLGDEGCVLIFNDKNWKISKGSLVVEKGVKVGAIYLCTGHIVPSTLIILEKNECLGIVATIYQGEQINVVDSKTTLWHHKLGHMSE